MMAARWMLAKLLLSGFCLLPSLAAAANTFETYCSLAGFAASLRQTVLVIDEAHVFAEPGDQVDPRNRSWRNLIGALLVSDRAASEQNFLPRERVTVVMARRDGAGLRPVFTGCLPFFSTDEKKAIAQNAGRMQSVETFFGTGPIAAAKKDMELFQFRLTNAVRDALQPGMLSPQPATAQSGDLATNSLVASLKQGNFLNLANGIPRVIIFSDMSRFLVGFPTDRAKARQLGLEKARAADLNFARAEIHVVGVAANPVARDALELFFLASRGELLSIGSTGVPVLTTGPTRVRFYQGVIQYPDNRFPLRIRLATDQSGTVVNSWVSIHIDREQFSPFRGVVTCSSANACTYVGDDVFSQVWNVHRGIGAEPIFNQALPFAGARALSFRIDGNELSGSVSDPLIRFPGVRNYKLEFSATLQPTGRF